MLWFGSKIIVTTIIKIRSKIVYDDVGWESLTIMMSLDGKL